MDSDKFEYYSDESLESCLLRLSHYQGFERFSHFAEEMLFRFLDENETVSGALPFDLDRINIYHAQVSRQMRVRAIRQLEFDLALPPFQILRLALTHSNADFSPDLRGVHRLGVDYPQAMLRKHHTPVCPQCLAQAGYIRQSWQFIPYQSCHIHHCDLLAKCPECQRSIDYQHSENITYCDCGYPFSQAQTVVSDDAKQTVARWLSGCDVPLLHSSADTLSISERYGFLLWYVQRYGDEDDLSLAVFVEFCRDWQQTLLAETEAMAIDCDVKRVRSWRETRFEEVFGTLLKGCSKLPNKGLGNNIVLATVVRALAQVVSKPSRSKSGDIGDILLNLLEASAILSCSTEEVYRLYQHGEIKAAVRPKIHTKLASYQSAFTLCSVIETKVALMCSGQDGITLSDMEWD